MNAISIDMDYIMKPVINLYNDISKAENPEKVWEVIGQVRNIDEIAQIDEKNFKFLIKVASKVLSQYNKENTKIVFAENHDYILEELTKHSNLRIINIDHHHDINYSFEQMRDVDKFDFVTPGNWVWYLDKYKKINEYVWVRNSNSDIYHGSPMGGGFREIVETNNIDLELFGNKIDLLFVCRSGSWLPPKFNIYFDYIYELICTFIGKKIKIRKENYCVGGLPRKCNENDESTKKLAKKPNFFC